MIVKLAKKLLSKSKKCTLIHSNIGCYGIDTENDFCEYDPRKKEWETKFSLKEEFKSRSRSPYLVVAGFHLFVISRFVIKVIDFKKRTPPS